MGSSYRFLFLFLILTSVFSESFCFNCDWTGSGVSTSGSGSGQITPVSLNCDSGSLSWSYPRGGLAVTIELPSTQHSTGSKPSFSGCFHVTSHTAKVRVYQFRKPNRLALLWQPVSELANQRSTDPSEFHPDRWRCFNSHGGHVTLFVEADLSEQYSLRKTLFEFEYELKPIVSEDETDPFEDCRPCSDDEILQQYCSSDFVVRGKLGEVKHFDHLDRSRIEIQHEKIISVGADIYNNDTTMRTKVSDKHLKRSLSGNGRLLYVWAPRVCNVHSGPGIYLLMGRRRLGVAMVSCSVSIDNWLTLKKKAEATNKNECMLES